MGDNLPTVWPAEPHTLAKHGILRGYLDAWLPILSRQSARVKSNRDVLFVDGFAGPGCYSGGEDGSPIIALKAALAQPRFPTPIQFLFIEGDGDRVKKLGEVLAGYEEQLAKRPDLKVMDPRKGDCAECLGSVLDEHAKNRRQFGPALVFLDQFGYSSVPMDLIARVLSVPQCEVFSYLDAKGMRRFLEDETKWPALTRAFGSEIWKAAIDLGQPDRLPFLLRTYRTALQKHARFVWHFSMYGEGNQALYWLFFATQSTKGLAQMKRAMWKVDDSGSFRFSDEDNPNQLRLLTEVPEAEQHTDLHRRLSGRTMTVEEIEVFVLTKTPYFKFADALQKLKSAGDIDVTDPTGEGRERGFADNPDLRVRFHNFQPSLL